MACSDCPWARASGRMQLCARRMPSPIKACTPPKVVPRVTRCDGLGALSSSLLVRCAVVLFVAAIFLAVPSVGGAVTSGGPVALAANRQLGLAGHRIGHVFVIVLENESAKSTFEDPSSAPYLAKTLRSRGAYLENYYAIGHFSADNYIAMISGQAPNPQTQADCVQGYDNFVQTGTPVAGQVVGSGCVYPQSVQTIGNQLSEVGLTWKGYMQDMGNDPAREPSRCAHPAVGAKDNAFVAVPGDGYVTRHDPFVYFHAIIDDAAYCDAHVVPLGSPLGKATSGASGPASGLATDLRSLQTTPNFSFIVPNVCNDGHDFPCINQRSGPSAIADIEGFLKTWVPLITRSAAFKKDGLLVITFDEGSTSDSSACCHEPSGPNTNAPGLSGPGGGRTGALLISPFIKGGTVTARTYNHYSLLASIEQNFGVSRLGYAAGAPVFGKDIFH